MSAFASLFGAASTSKDADLDALFARTKSEPAPTRAAAVSKAAKTPSSNDIKPPEQIIAAARIAKSKNESKARNQLKSSKKRKAEALANDDESSDDHAEVEESYAVKQAKNHAQRVLAAGNVKGKGKAPGTVSDTSDDDEGMKDEASDDEEQELVHETVLQARKAAAAAAGKVSTGKKEKKPRADVEESREERNARTIFVGNVPLSCVTDRTTKKAFIRHFTTALLSVGDLDPQSLAKLDSIRFRSLPLAAPVPAHSGTKQPQTAEKDEADGDNHARKRARRWKEGELGDEGEEAASEAPKAFLTAAQKRKVAFIQGKVHKKATACTAYLVWKSADPAKMTAAEIAALIIKNADNTVFEGHTLRVDRVVPKLPKTAAELDAQEKKELAKAQKAKAEEDKRTTYIGALDFEEQEQAIRDLCEKLMQEERGDGDWVERVRLVKDPETGLGKGFAYVRFKDQECVDVMLGLDATRVKLSKRKLRLERCKSSAIVAKLGKAASQKQQDGKHAKKEDKKARKPKIAINVDLSAPPTKRPDVGESLRDLSKDDRKAIKASDEERLKRRMEKKMRKRELIKADKVKDVIDKKIKKTNTGKATGAALAARKSVDKKKTRIRSAALELKKNTKKT